jgi:Fic family protein
MSYIEQKQRKAETYAYFVKRFSFMGKQYKINKYIGKKPLVTKERYLEDNLEGITKQEFELKKPFFPKQLLYHNKLLKKVEYDAIRLNNLVEAKQANWIEAEVIKEFVYNSNNIEGSKLPKHELEKVFENKKSSYANKNEILEAKNSIKAYNYLKNDFSFSMRSIKKLYYVLTKDLVMETGDYYPKGFRKSEIIVGNEPTLPPKEIKKELENLLNWYKKNKKTYSLKLAYDFHIRYEAIHPFRDGNGRTGRLIMNKILMKDNYPLMIVFKDNKNAYFNSIKQGLEGKTKKYYQFMLEQQKKSYELTNKLLKS